MAVYRTVTANATLSDNTVQAEGTVSDEIARVTAVSQSVQMILSPDYGDLTNKPEINSHILEGNQSSADLGLASAEHTHTKSQITDLSKMLTKVSASGGSGEISLTNSYSDGSFDSYVVGLSGYVESASYSNGTLKLKRKNLLPDITAFTADSSPTAGSQQLVRSGGVYTALASKADSSHTHTKSEITDFPSLASVATSGSYNDLSNKPTIPVVPTNVSAFTNDAGYLTSAPVTSVNGQTGAVTGLQTTGNKVTSLSSSSTDTQYPSAKCVYDLVGNIEALLASI